MRANTANVVTARTERVMHAGLYTAKVGNTRKGRRLRSSQAGECTGNVENGSVT